jgi:hypothetical protein
MEIVLDGQTCNCAQDVIANVAQNAFPLLKTTQFSTCWAIVLITENNLSTFRPKQVTYNRTVRGFYTGFPCGLVLHTNLTITVCLLQFHCFYRAFDPPFYEPMVRFWSCDHPQCNIFLTGGSLFLKI